MYHQVQYDVTGAENWMDRKQSSVREGERGGGLSDESGEWHTQIAMSPGGSWVISTLSIHLSMNSPLLLLSLSFHLIYPSYSSSIAHSSCLLRSQYLTSQVTEIQCRRFVRIRIIQLAHQQIDLTSEMDKYTHVKTWKHWNCRFPDEGYFILKVDDQGWIAAKCLCLSNVKQWDKAFVHI